MYVTVGDKTHQWRQREKGLKGPRKAMVGGGEHCYSPGFGPKKRLSQGGFQEKGRTYEARRRNHGLA